MIDIALTSIPVGMKEVILTSQEGCTNHTELDYTQQAELYERLKKRLKKLKIKNGLTTHAKWKNFRYKMSKKKAHIPKEFDEMLSVASTIRKMQLQFQSYKEMCEYCEQHNRGRE